MTSTRSPKLSASAVDVDAVCAAAERRSDHRALVIVGALALLGAVLRFATINTRSFWLDEAITVEQTNIPLPDVIAGQIGNVHPPLFHVLMHLWIQVFGISEVAMRSFATAFGIATIPVAYWVGRVAYGRRAGVIAAGLVALSPYYIWYSQEARMYAPMMFLGFASLGFFLSLLAEHRLRWWIGFAVTSLLGIYTHFFFLFLLVGEAFAFVWVVAQRQAARVADGTATASARRPWRIFADEPMLAPAFITATTLAALFSVWVLRSVVFSSNALVSSATGSGLGYGQRPPELAWRLNDAGRVLIEMSMGFFPNVTMFALVAMWPLFISLMLLMIDGLRPLTARSIAPVLAVSGLILIVAVGQWQGQVLASRYFISASAPVTIVLAGTLALAPRRVATPLMMVGAIALVALWGNQSFNPENAMRHDNRQAIQRVVDSYQPGDKLVFEPFYTGPVFDYYVPRTIPYYQFPRHGLGGYVRRGKPELAKDLDRAIGPTRRVWLMLSYQDIEVVRGDAYNTINWFLRNGFRMRSDVQLNNVRLMLFVADQPREGYDFQERRLR